MHFRAVESFAQWRDAARELLEQAVSPENVSWSPTALQPTLFGAENSDVPPPKPKVDLPKARVPREFVRLAEIVSCHRDPRKWMLLYRVLWRLRNGEPHLLQLHSDDDMLRLHRMAKAVTRDAHKMKAFVRFRRLDGSVPEAFVAWHRPDHLILQLVGPFFARRFKGMLWTIITPDESAVWDQKVLRYGPGAPSSAAPDGDGLEELWKTYYASTFNPARIKIAAMKREMPTRYWKTMPETELIEPLLSAAEARVDSMLKTREGFNETAAHYFPAENDFTSLRIAAQSCQACELCRHATQTVFGEGPTSARIVLIGEQPGDAEDLSGRPFEGPAGQLLDEILEAIGIDRGRIYVTNVVKHFKFIRRGKRRLHVKPSSREIYACRPWLEEELKIVRPDVTVCLGATASQALFGRDFRLSVSRGEFLPTDWCANTLATWHPSAILRMQDKDRQAEMRSQLTTDLAAAWLKLPPQK